jgi:hypothetical protein
MNTSLRHAAVAGRFYPDEANRLRHDIDYYTQTEGDKVRAIACVAPHAGYVYSGHVAGAVYGRLQLPTRFIILCPNHTGAGAPLAIMREGAWLTPLGQVSVDTELATDLMSACSGLEEDTASQRSEHGVEVQIPFLQAFLRQFTFVPITIGVNRYEPLMQLGEAVGEVVASHPGEVLIIASTDMNHYESDDVTRTKDSAAIAEILKLDPRKLYDVVVTQKISMCGYGPTVAMLTAAVRLGAKSADLVKYATSGGVSGDRDFVVGYAGVVIR